MSMTASPAAPTVPRRKLSDLRPKDIQEIGARYHIPMTGIVGTTPDRILTTAAYGLGVFMLCMFASMIIAGILGVNSDAVFWIVSLAMWTLIMGSTYWVYLVIVPKLTGLITTNNFTEELHVYGTGLGLKFPWESYSQDDYIDLQADLVDKRTRFVTKEGVGIEYPWSMQFTPFLPMLPLYVRTENRAIADGLEEVVETTFSGSVLDVSAEAIRHPQVLELIRKNLLQVLSGEPVLDKDGNEVTVLDTEGYPIEERFAISVELATLGAPVYDKDYQELLMGSLKANQMRKDAGKLAKPSKDPTKWSGMSAEKAMRQIMILNNEPGVTDESFTIDLSDRAREAAGDASHILRAGAVIAGGITRNRGGGRRGRGSPTPPASPTGGTP